MELKDFIKNALVGIVEAVDAANESHDRFKMFSNIHDQKNIDGELVEFEISVTVD